MHDKGTQKLADGELARKSRAIQSLKEILGLDEGAYQAHLDSLNEAERATYETELKAYIETCTIMSGEYLQWSSQLLLAAPEGVESESSYQSSLIAPMGAVLLNALEKSNAIAFPQHLRDAAAQIERLADAKRRFLTELYGHLRDDERESYGDLLEACDPLLCSMPDLKLYETHQRLILAWKFLSQLLIKPLDGVPDNWIEAAATKAHKRITELSSGALRPLLEAAATPKKDSLSAELLLASMVNRSHWELLEYERLEQIATQSLSRLTRGLKQKGNHHIPAYLEKAAFKDWLLMQLSQNRFPGEEAWRTLKRQHLERFYFQATWILDWEKLNGVEHSVKEDALLNMCALHFAWSYCTREKHDLRVPDVKDLDLVNGREIETDEQVPLTRIMYQQRQLNTMLLSYQHVELNPQKLETYTKCNRDGRRQQMQFIRSNLHNLSLAQWKSLTNNAWNVLDALLQKHGAL
ncbi:hypothetical protein [Pseudomonas sp. CFBP 5748]